MTRCWHFLGLTFWKFRTVLPGEGSVPVWATRSTWYRECRKCGAVYGTSQR